MPGPLLPFFRGAHRDQRGFTLIELLVVVLIIGILAAIALPVFLGQQQKSQDASAKTAARSAVTQVEACLVDATVASAPDCGDPGKNTELRAAGPRVVVTGASVASGSATYAVDTTSVSGHRFRIAKASDETYTFTASPTDARWAENSTTSTP